MLNNKVDKDISFLTSNSLCSLATLVLENGHIIGVPNMAEIETMNKSKDIISN